MNTAVLNTIVDDNIEIMERAWMPNTAYQSKASPLGVFCRLDKLTKEAEFRKRLNRPRNETSADSITRAPEPPRAHACEEHGEEHVTSAKVAVSERKKTNLFSFF
jgi:hypothetical protein|tara:strand:- start:7001 stop:7315 length:315 start_codon:yes stop_codon:yes gene_type:complete